MSLLSHLVWAFALINPLFPTDALVSRDALRPVHYQPSVDITLVPLFEPVDQNITSLNVSMILHNPKWNAQKGTALITLPLSQGPTPTARYDGDAIQAWDDVGSLVLSKVDTDDADPWRSWVPKRPPEGDVVLSFIAPGRFGDENTPRGPRIDLRADQGGLIGQGIGFLPYPPSEEDWDISVKWVLNGAPENTVTVWSVAPGLRGHAIGHPSELLGRAGFAVGPLTEGTEATYPRLRVYWIGSPPWDMEQITKTTAEIFDRISTHFDDTDSNFTVFFRRVLNGYGGTGGYRIFLMEYSPDSAKEVDSLTLHFGLAHEIVHEYALTWPVDDKDGWYIEGIANYYAPAALGPSSYFDGRFLTLLNSMAQAYYTSPVIHLNMDYVIEHQWDNFHITNVFYMRGFMYLAQLDTLIAKKTNRKKSLDDIVLELYRMKKARERCQSAEFLQLLGEIIGHEEAKAGFDAMWNGQLIVPNAESLVGYDLVRRDRYMFELGFDPISLQMNRVIGLKKGSRADIAGVKEGDEIVGSLIASIVADNYDRSMEITVRRKGKEVLLKWWPRSMFKVECWEWQKSTEFTDL